MFAGQYNSRPQETIECTWEDFVDDLPETLSTECAAKESLPGVVFAHVRERRCNANTGEHTAVAIDVDHPPKGFLKRVKRSGLQCAAYETASSREPGKGLRLRVVAALSEPVPPHAVRAARRELAEMLGLDPSGSGVDRADAISQLMFIGRVAGTDPRRHWVFDGKPWTPPPPGEAPTEGPATYGEASDPAYDAAEVPPLPEALTRAIEPRQGDQRQGGRALMRGIGGLLARKGYHPDAIAAAVETLPSARPRERAEQAREAAEQWYAGDPRTAGADAIVEHFGKRVGREVLAAIDRAAIPGYDWWAAVARHPGDSSWRRGVREWLGVGPGNDNADASNGALECMSWNEIMAPLPEVSWICERLGIAAGGRPNILAAPAGAGKTLSAQALALAVASGQRRLFGEFECAHGPVLHIDLDQGQRATQHRYQMLAQGMRLKRSDAIDLQCSFFGLSLTHGERIDAKAVERLARTVRGKTLVIVDSLRALAPGIDENDSAFGSVLGALAEISNDVGVTWLVIHHSGKGDGTAVRGSSAIRDRAGCIWALTREGDALHWTQDKISEMAIDPAARFATTLETTPGLGVELRIAPDEPSAGKASGAPTLEERRMVAEVVAARSDGIAVREIVMVLGQNMGRNRCRDVVDVMLADRDLVRDGKGPASRIHASERAHEIIEENCATSQRRD